LFSNFAKNKKGEWLCLKVSRKLKIFIIMKKNEFKIKVIEKPSMNFGDAQNLSRNALNELKGGAGADKKMCFVIFDKFKIFDGCICYTSRFLANSEDVVFD
jgi:hypothetical protein